MEQAVHRRLIAPSKPLRDELEKLGFKKVSENHRQRTWKKGDKYVEEGYDGMVLYTMIGTVKDINHKGISIHDEMLKFFATRNPKTHEQK